MGMSLQRETN